MYVTPLLILRVILLLCGVMILVYLVDPTWCQQYMENYIQNHDQWNDVAYEVPWADRRPPQTVHEYRAGRDLLLFKKLVETRQKYKRQYHLGSVMKDGFHSALPDNAMWRDGMIVVGDEIIQLSKDAQQEVTPPHV